MAKENPNLSYNNIPNLDIDWESIDPSNNKPWSGASIERVIKSSIKDALKQASESSLNKIGAQWFDSSSFTMYHFKNVEDKRKWEESGQTIDDRDPSYLIGEPTILSFAGTLNRIQFVNPAGTTTLYFTTNANEANITVGFESQEKGITDTEWKEVSEDFVVSVSVDRGAVGNYETFITDKQVLNGNTLTFDVRRYLATGSNRIKVTAKGVDSGAVANLTYQVTLTSMYLSPSNFTWYTPFIEGKTYNLGGMNIGGNLEKTLFVKVTKEGYEKLYEVAIGTNIYTDTAYIFKGLEFPEAGTGVYNVDIWLEAGTLQSEHLSYNIICVKAEEQFTAKVVSIGNPTKVVYNFSDNELFEYCVYNGGQSSASPHLRLSTIINTNPNIIVDEDLVDVATSTPLKYVASLEVESQEAEIQLEAYMQYGNEQQVVFPIDNSKAFPATSGAVFYLNPSTRSNAQENKLNVVNAINSAEYTAEWNGMAWTDGVDGWTTDESGRKCLRLPAFTNVNINYQPLSSVTAKTIEFVYKVKNASDYSDAIITICDDASKADFKGIKITPKNILVHSSQLNTQDSLQDYNAIDEEVLSVIVTIIPNYKTNYGNLCQIYCNGEKVRSFEYANSDSFATSANIIMGNDTADLFLYKMRVYNIGFEKNFAMKNYVNSLPDRATREAMNAELNSCVNDSMQLDYDTCVKNGYNTMVIEMLNGKDIPSLANQEAGLLCNLQIKINNIIEGELDEEMEALLTGTEIKNEVIEGQGTTAMTYPRWNFRWKLSKAYGKRRITAKKNVASSMQSHKMGATRLYNYLYSEIIGKNEVGGKVAVLQYPVFGFKKSLIDGTTNQYVYTPIGLYTIGADKGDKHTFGYDNAQYENSVMHLEGADHTPKSVGFDYPYEATKFSSSAEAMGAINTDGTVIGAWEVGMAGKLENNVKADEEGVQEMLDAEWKPAYNVAYHNSPYVMGVSETIASINANVDEWRKGKTADGKSFTLFEIYNASDYALHYYDIQTKQYKPTGVNVLTDVGLTASDVSGMSLAEIDAKIIELRKARFVAEWGTYFHTDDAILHYTFCLIFGVTDNFKKNTYPYKFPFLANGGKWRWRVDDLDTLFDVINQGLATKQPDILVGDTDATGSIYVGDTSVLWTLIKETQTNEIKAMAHKIFSAMVSHPLAEGANTQAKLVGCIKHFFWDFAQNYFPASAYNVDVEWTYEDTWANKNSWKEVNPLSQALGGHFEAEKDWVTMRMLFMSSYFNFGAFTHTGYNDASTGQMVYGGADAHTFEITPAVSINPTIIRGSTETITYGDRVKANETAPLTVSDASGDDTRVYVQGLDYIKDLGDLKDLKVSAKNPTLSVASKRLQSLKVGDADASKVPTSGTISNLSFGDCPSLMVIDAQNLGTLTGIIDLSLLPRLREALFGGTNVKSINLPSGSKIERLQIPSSVTNLELIRCNNLQGFVEDSNFVYNQNAYIRTDYGVGSTISLTPESGSGFICTVIDCTKYDYFIISGTGYGWERLWCFVDEDNKIVSVADPEITVTDLELKVPMNAKKLVVNFTIKNNPSYSLIGHKQGTIEYDTLPNVMTLRLENNATIDGFSILKGIYSTNNNALRYVRIVGFDYEGDANDVMMIANLATDKDKDGNYHSYNGISSEGVNQDETIPIIEGKLKVNGCIYEEDDITLKEFYPNLTLEVTGGYYIRFADAEVQRICAENWGDGIGITNEQAKSITILGAQFAGNLDVEIFNEFEEFSNLTTFNGSPSVIGGFCRCKNLKSIKLPKSLTTMYDGIVSQYQNTGAFKECESLTEIVIPPLVTRIPQSCFHLCNSLETVTLEGKVVTFAGASFAGCESLLGINGTDFVETIEGSVFSGDTNLQSVSFPSLVSDLKENTFYNCTSLRRVESLGVADKSILNGSNGGYGNMGVFHSCSSLEFVDLSSIISIGAHAFRGCTSLEDIGSFNERLTTIGNSTFYNCSNLKVSNIPDSIESLDSLAFYNCTSLEIEDLSLPNLESLGQNAFYGVKIKKISNLGKLTTLPSAGGTTQNFGDKSALEEVVLPDTLTSIPSYSFNSYPNLSKIGNGVFVNIETINANAFYNLPNWVQAVSFPKLTKVESGTANGFHFNFVNCGFTGFHAPLLDLVNVLIYQKDNGIFRQCARLKVIEIGALTYIPFGFASECPLLVNVTDLSKVTKIDYQAFKNTPKLEIDLVLPECVSILGSGASGWHGTFYNSGILSLNAPKLVDIGKDMYGNNSLGVFQSCKNLKTIMLRDVTTIGFKSFSDCAALETVIINNTTPPTLGNKAFASTNSTFIIYVPDASVEVYKSATNWSSYASRIKGISELPIDNPELYEELKEYIGEVPQYIRFADEEVKRVLMANGVSSDGVGITKADAEKVTDIGGVFVGSAIEYFDELEKFENITFIDGAKTNLDYRGFINCASLKRLSLPVGVRINDGGWVDIKGGAFVGSSVENVKNLDKVSYIGQFTFREVSTLSWDGIYRNYELVTIGNEAFFGCTNFTAELVLPSLTMLGEFAFCRSGIKRVLDLGSVTAIHGGWPAHGQSGDFYDCPNLELVILPSTIASISNYAFAKSAKLSNIIIKATVPPTLANTGAFSGIDSNFKVYVPDASVEAYSTATNWSSFASRIKGISELPIDNPTLYDEIKDYLEGVEIKEMIIKPNSQKVPNNMLQLTCYYLGEIVTPQWSVEGDATINANGLLTFNSEGEVIITATYNGVSESNTYEYVVYPTEVDGQYTIVGFIPVVSRPTITWGVISGKYGTLTEYNDAEEYVDHWGASGSAISRTITLNANTAQIKVAFYTNNLANSFIRNDTTGEYYYKGENVE